MTVKLLSEHHLEFISLKEGDTGSSESIHVKMPHCLKSHIAAHLSRSAILLGQEWSSDYIDLHFIFK